MNRDSRDFFVKSRYVTELTPRNFDPKRTFMLKNYERGCGAVLFYCAWCPHCREIKSEWEKFAETATYLSVYGFNCEKYHDHVLKMNEEQENFIAGYPTIVFYSGKNIAEYNGDKNYHSFLSTSKRFCEKYAKK